MCCFANIGYFVIFKEDIARSIISCSTEFFDLICDFGGMVVVWNASIILRLAYRLRYIIGVSEWGWYSTPLSGLSDWLSYTVTLLAGYRGPSLCPMCVCSVVTIFEDITNQYTSLIRHSLPHEGAPSKVGGVPIQKVVGFKFHMVRWLARGGTRFTSRCHLPSRPY